MANRLVLKIGALVLAAGTALTACSTPAAQTGTKPSESGSPAASSSSSAPADKALKIGVTFPVLDQFLQTVADGMQARAKEIGATVDIVAAEEKTDTQLGQVENFISAGVDAIIVVPVDTDAAGPMTEAAQKAGIPLVYVNRKPSDLPANVPYVGSDSVVAGTLQGEQLAKLANYKGNVAILIGDPANEAATARTKGVKDVIAKYPDMKVIKEQAGNWYREKGLSITENWLQSGDQVDVIAANNDEMALGAIQALKNANKLDKVLVGGVDATTDALTAMAAGELEVTVFQDAAGQGAGGVDAAAKLTKGETVDPVIDIPYQLVTPENMAQFKK